MTVREVMAAGEGDTGDGGGLLLRVRGLSASWVFRFTAPNGRRREMGLGVAHRANPSTAGESLMAARKLAHEAREEVQAGLDPIDTRDGRRHAARIADAEAKAEAQQQQLTLARAARDYHERVVEPRLTQKHAAQWISSLENHVPAAVWNKPISAITAPELLVALSGVRSLEEKGQRVPETLRRIRQRLDSVFEDAIFHGRCATNPAAAVRRKMREQLPVREAGAFRALDYREAPVLAAKIRAAEGVAARCLELAFLTAARTSEALGARWDEFDLQEGTWTVPPGRMKGKRESHVVHLSGAAQDVVQGQRGLHPVLLFPSPVKLDAPLSNMAMLKTLERLGYRDQTTAHGLCRATFSTWANDTAAARPDVIEACLAHKEADRVKAAYNRAQFTRERATLMEAWAKYLREGRGAVVPLRAA